MISTAKSDGETAMYEFTVGERSMKIVWYIEEC